MKSFSRTPAYCIGDSPYNVNRAAGMKNYDFTAHAYCVCQGGASREDPDLARDWTNAHAYAAAAGGLSDSAGGADAGGADAERTALRSRSWMPFAGHTSPWANQRGGLAPFEWLSPRGRHGSAAALERASTTEDAAAAAAAAGGAAPHAHRSSSSLEIFFRDRLSARHTAETVSCILCTVTFHANHAHNLTRSP